MKIIKTLNNNFALALDNAGNQMIVSGKGIGFGKVPREVEDLSVINRSYYDVDDIYVSMINDIPEQIINISSEIVDHARNIIDNPISSNIVFTLADHINFAVERYQKNLNIHLPILYDIQNLFDKEMCVGKYAIDLLWKKMNIYLPKEEAAYVALHFINAEAQSSSVKSSNCNEKIIEDIVRIIEEENQIHIDKTGFNYSRFASHMQYLLKRTEKKEMIQSVNAELYREIKNLYPNIITCVEKVSSYLQHTIKTNLPDEEKMYLALHINRLCSREDSNH